MTDLLNAQKDRKRKCVVVCQIVKEFFPRITPDQASTWLQRYRIFNPPPVVLFHVRTAGIKSAPRSFRAERRLFSRIFTSNSTSPFNSHSNIHIRETKARLSLATCTQRYQRIIEVGTLKKTMAITKMTTKAAEAYLQDGTEAVTKISRSPTGIFADIQRSISKNLKTRTIRKCFTPTMRNYPLDVSTPYHLIIFRYLYRLLKEINRYRVFIPNLHERQLRRRAIRMRRNRINTSRKTHYRSFSCRAMFYWTEERKPIEHLSANDLQEIAGADESVEQECATEYCFGGYKSTEIGEVLGNRYEVIRKLGFGHFSTVWLCKDKEVTCSNMYSAVKIVKAAEMFNCVAQDEIKLLRCIKSADPNHPGYKHIIQMLDFFQEHSLNGYHTCISFELMGPSLLHLLVQSDYRGIHLPGVRIILKQLLQGLVYLHNICRIIHTDIKPENILIKVKDDYVRNLVETSSRYKELGVQMPRTYVSSEAWEHYIYCRPIPPLGPIPGAGCYERTKIGATRASSFPKEEGEPKMKPEKHSRSNKLHQPMYISPNIEVKIADLGNACWEDHHFSCNIQTKQYRALEVILGADYSFPADMWSVGCLAFELATAEYLFNPKRTSSISSTEDHVYLICETLGSIPRYIAQRGNLRTHDDSINLKYWKTEDVLVDKYLWKRVDAIPFATFVEGLIEPDPELRLTAAGALNSNWINETF